MRRLSERVAFIGIGAIAATAGWFALIPSHRAGRVLVPLSGGASEIQKWKLDLPDTLDLMEYHDGVAVAEGDNHPHNRIVEYGTGSYGDLGVQFLPPGEESKSNAYCVRLTIRGQSVDLAMPNVRYDDYRFIREDRQTQSK